MPQYKFTNASAAARYVPKPVNKVLTPWDSVIQWASDSDLNIEELSKLILSGKVIVERADATDVAPIFSYGDAVRLFTTDKVIPFEEEEGGGGEEESNDLLVEVGVGVYEFRAHILVHVNGGGDVRVTFHKSAVVADTNIAISTTCTEENYSAFGVYDTAIPEVVITVDNQKSDYLLTLSAMFEVAQAGLVGFTFKNEGFSSAEGDCAVLRGSFVSVRKVST